MASVNEIPDVTQIRVLPLVGENINPANKGHKKNAIDGRVIATVVVSDLCHNVEPGEPVELVEPNEPETNSPPPQSAAAIPIVDSNCDETQILNLARPHIARLFTDEFEQAFAWCWVQDPVPHLELIPLKDKKFASYLRCLDPERMMKRKAIKEAISMLEAYAIDSRDTLSLSNRIARKGDAVLVDLCDCEWKMIEITKSGFEIKQQSDPIFIRHSHQLPLCKPDFDVDPRCLFEMLDRVDDENEKFLFVATIASFFDPTTESPIMDFIGPQGSAKSTLCRYIRLLIDPSKVALLKAPDQQSLALVFFSHALPCFENVNKFPRPLADDICRFVTGSGIQKRKLFTDSDTVFFSAKRPLLINGISLPSTRPDFLDRCVVINCTRRLDFLPQSELLESFEKNRSRYFGGLLTLVSKTLGFLEQVPSDGKFRMASFVRFGRAVALALGYPTEKFDVAYQANLDSHRGDILDDEPIARLVTKFASKYDAATPWEGTVAKLLDELRYLAKHSSLSSLEGLITKSTAHASTQLRELAPLLSGRNIVVEELPRTKNARKWKIYKSFSETSDANNI